ncbi:Tripartite-type tricarboxylate transporter, receptor component TctC [Variovorax sp. OK605]|jgi:tripartite-type tricarboxylate transporter receptor subunit TctC|uniref:Bug family tripartite tricarboxylate transporter substrate binding protein n=1 Tax=unclassified Variovorax TaxID=663243 RepID=UPI0008B616CA|nr:MULTISPECIES: tripartite tricarboxylate transporter substrate binding protein [unclassified Variovorax]SEK16091.1 Tripartite-type tricarboxylate transporter, receptor component TctC [Variovorax sp. OK202]SFE31947.1 Tripartite-type tricarboxylate transporter, receptor component TctC [Variovorax sp. OK212]SFQ64127.1 Tripartite-type tricarboxylate transporter, receptor component TctC [Variovorax sp. OK605]
MKKTFTWSRRRTLATALAAALAACALPGAHAQGPWPGTQPIKLVVPFTAGSGTDIVARLVAEKLGPVLGTSVIVDNKPGAGGTLGAALTAKAPADGYTLLVHSAGHLVNPWIYKGLSYDTLKDFTGITPMASLPNVLVTAPSHFTDVKDLVAKAKAKPGGLNYGSAGNGSATHMNAEVFRLAAGLDAQHVPFRGTPEAMTEVMAGRVDWFFAPMVSALPLIQSGKLQALAVGTGKRSSALPSAPTTVEAGVPGSEYLFWVGLFAPAKTPQPVVERLQAEVAKIMVSPELKERLEKLGAEPFTMPSAQFNRFIVDETAKAQQVVKAASIKVD